MNIKRSFTAALFVAATAMPLSAQPNQPDFTITPDERKEVIEGSIAKLKEAYVFPETARRMEAAVRERMAKGEYDRITSAKELTAKLTDDFRAVSRDKHLSVKANPNGFPDQKEPGPPTPEQQKQMRASAARVNFGFEKVERLQGNIGYIDIRGFMPEEIAGDTGTAAMSFVANTDALIVDLRKNGGGHPEMIAFLTSYLFDKPTHLNDIYTEQTKSTESFWTLPDVPGAKFGGKKPVYVLTSNYTFSGGEEFAYNLKNLKRATVIGETTGGGAHPVKMMKVSKRFAIGVPFARAISPITKTNWEGTGVSPDIALPADQAFDRAYRMALESLIESAEDAGWKTQLQKVLQEKAKS